MCCSSHAATKMYLTLWKFIVMPGCRFYPHHGSAEQNFYPPAGWLEALLEAFPPAYDSSMLFVNSEEPESMPPDDLGMSNLG